VIGVDRQTADATNIVTRQLIHILIEEKREAQSGAYGWFVDNVLKSVVGSHAWKSQIGCGNDFISSVATNTDEAFALVTLENGFERWEYEVTHPDEKPAYLHAPAAMYTGTGGTRNSWSAAGIQQFNELVDQVRIDRTTEGGRSFEQRYKENKQGQAQEHRARRRSTIGSIDVSPANDLDDDIEEGSVVGLAASHSTGV